MNVFPYSDFHRLNLDWILEQVKKCVESNTQMQSEIKSYDDKIAELKSFVIDYFKKLNYSEEILQVIEQLFSSTDFSEYIAQYLNKRDMVKITALSNMGCCIRERYARKEIAQNYQTGTIYSTGDYSPSAQKYWYFIESFADDSPPNLMVWNINNNTFVTSVTMGDFGHGGIMYIRDNKLYTCNSSKMLQIWDISSITPVLNESKTISIIPYHIIGWHEQREQWLMADGGGNVYAVSEDFTSAELLYTLSTNGVYTNLQDYHYDSKNDVIYRLSFYPSTVWVYDASSGNLITNISIPEISNYIAVGEVEGIFVHDYHMYILSSKICGCVGSQTMELCGFYANLHAPNGGRNNYMSVGGVNAIYVDSVNGDPLNRNGVYTGATFRTFKYVEDAQNMQRKVGGEIVFSNDYPYSWHLFAECYFNFQNHTSGAIRFDSGARARFSNIAGFTGAPYNNAWIYLIGSNDITINKIPDDVDSAAFIIYASRCRLQFTTNFTIHHCYLEGCVVDSCGTLGEYIYSIGSILNVRGCEITAAATQYFSISTVFNGVFVYNGNLRTDFIENIGTITLPTQATAESLGTAAYYFHPVRFILMSAGSSAISSHDWYETNGTRRTVSCTTTRTSGTSPYGNFTYYRYSFTLSSTPPPTGNVWLIKSV